MAEQSPVFEKIYRDYLDQVAGLDLSDRASILGIRRAPEGVWIPFFNREFCVTDTGITDASGRQPIHAVSVVLCRYVILCPDRLPESGTEWVSYRNFKDAAPFAAAFAKNTEAAIAENFAGRLTELAAAGRKLGGTPLDTDLAYDLTMQFYGLPRVPVFLLFNDADAEFGAECSVLFEKRAEQFLDMECLAIVGWLLSDYLARAAGLGDETLI